MPNRARDTIDFGPFRLDAEAEQLWRGATEVPLRAKSFAVLVELVRKRGRLVTKDELFRSCWADTTVTPTVLRVCIREIRAALGEDATQPLLLETVGRRGYRLIAGTDAGETTLAPLIGRDRELALLRRALAHADAGLRQVVFVTGEPGLGKTTLLEHFVEETRARTRARIAVGQCMELTGAAEAYLPVLDLLGQLAAAPDGNDVRKIFEHWAPSWLLQMPSLLDVATAEDVRRRVPSPNRDRMLRELGEALEALATDRPLVIVLEDLHWSDTSSVDALAYVAQRTRPARLLVIGSYRPVDLALRDHPLKAMKQSLQARSRCAEIPLELLTHRDTDAYLAHRLRDHAIDPALGHDIHRRTDGSPLFMTAIVGDLLERGILTASEGRWGLSTPLDGIIPESIRELAQQQLDRLAPLERRVLDVASTVGAEFALAPVAAASELSLTDVEEVCARLTARNQLVSATGVAAWPDGTASSTYKFRHAVYREVVDRALSPAARRQFHRRVGERIELGYAGETAPLSAVLAFHFERADDDARAVHYHREAAAAAKARFAHREVIVHLQAALARTAQRPACVERAQTELQCLLDLGGAFFAARGCASDDAVAVHRQALELADHLQLPQARITAHSALYTFHIMRADVRRAREIAEDLLTTATRMGVPFFTLIGHTTLGGTLFNLADFAGARLHLERAHALWEPGFPPLPLDPTVIYRTMLGFTMLLQGEPAAGMAWIRSSLAHAESTQNPYNVSYAHELAAQYYATSGERQLALAHAEAAIPIAAEHGFPVHAAVASIVRGWAQRDLTAIREGLADHEGIGQYLATSLFRSLLVETALEQGDAREARATLAATFAFVERSGEQRHLAELHRLQGESLLLQADAHRDGHRIRSAQEHPEAEASLERALTVSRQQGARFWELRAALSLAGYWAARGRRVAAREVLDDAAGAFTDGHALPDLARARELGAHW